MTPKAYIFRLKDDGQLVRSQSGGAFFALAETCLLQGGVVYGAAFAKNWRIVHARASDMEELESLRKSKYVQSDMRGVYAQVRHDLRQGVQVLFSGTPCQVDGLKSYLPTKLKENLTCVDIVCSGVPSPAIWEDYIAWLERTRHSKLVKVCFRDKRFGWHGAKESFLFANGREEYRATSNALYFSGYSRRESCGHCQYASLRRVGDVSIGDLWGLPADSPYEQDAKGVSLLLVNSDKGEAILKRLNVQNCLLEPYPLEKCLQPRLQTPPRLNPNRRKFEAAYKRWGFRYIGMRYADIGFIPRLRKLYAEALHLLRNFCSSS